MKKNSVWLLVGILMMLLSLAGCAKESEENKIGEAAVNTTESVVEEATEESTEESTEEVEKTPEEIEAELTAMFVQMREPEKGDTVATMTTSFGVIKILLFGEAMPKTVENFVTHSENGYYDGLTFHRVMKDFMIQGGDPLGTGTGGESIWGEKFEDEFNQFYFPYKGALCMANSGPNTNGSQFFIVQLGEHNPSVLEQMKTGGWPSAMTASYETLGGTDWLYGIHTVFGQVQSGMDVVDTIAATPVNASSLPDEAVIIESITIEIIE